MAIDRGQPAPDWYLDRPELSESEMFFLEAFEELTDDRAHGATSVGRIPWTARQQYAERHRLDEINQETFHAVLKRLDGVYLKRLKDDRRARDEATRTSNKRR